MAGELTRAVRSRYWSRLPGDGEGFAESVIRIDGFVHDVLGRWEEAGEWIQMHLASFRRPADEESEPREASRQAKLSFSRRRGQRAVEPPEGNGRPPHRDGVAKVFSLEGRGWARARRDDPAGGIGRVSSDEWSLIERALGPLGSRAIDIPPGGERPPAADVVRASGRLPGSRVPEPGGSSPFLAPDRPSSRPERGRELAAGKSLAEVLRRLRAEREWESRGF